MNWPLRSCFSSSRGVVLVDLRLGLLDERQDVAHAEDPLGHPVGVEALEVVELLARRGVEDRLAGDRLDDSAAPPRASPSSLDITTPSKSTASANCSATLTASWPVIASTTSRIACGLTAPRMRLSSSMSSSSTCRRPLVSTMRTSLPSIFARSSAQRGDVDRVLVGALLVDLGAGLGADLDELVDRGRAVDVARGDGDRRAVLLLEVRASFAVAVVLPEPCRPAMRITVGGRGENVMPAAAPPMSFVSSSLTILTTCWPGLSCADDLLAERALLELLGELADDLEVDVGLEQREADLAHRRVDVVLGQRPALADVGEGLLELLGEGVKHVEAPCRRMSVTPSRTAGATCTVRASARDVLVEARDRPRVRSWPSVLSATISPRGASFGQHRLVVVDVAVLVGVDEDEVERAVERGDRLQRVALAHRDARRGARCGGARTPRARGRPRSVMIRPPGGSAPRHRQRAVARVRADLERRAAAAAVQTRNSSSRPTTGAGEHLRAVERSRASRRRAAAR